LFELGFRLFTGEIFPKLPFARIKELLSYAEADVTCGIGAKTGNRQRIPVTFVR